MNIVMAAAENGAIEGGKVGGIGDVVRDIPLALADAGHTVQVVCPAYGLFCKRPAATLKDELSVTFAGKSEVVQVFSYTSVHTKVKYWVLEHPIFALGGIGAIYCNDPDNRPFATDAIKFALFSAAVAEAVIQNVFSTVDVLHLHDWHAALIAVLAKYNPRYDALNSSRIVYTIHNLALQGVRPFKDDESSLAGWFPELDYSPIDIADPRADNCINPMRAGINLSDRVHAVSPSYAKEILVPSCVEKGYFGGEGLEQDLQKAALEERLHGILNGCEYPDTKAKTKIRAKTKGSRAQMIQGFESQLIEWLGNKPVADSALIIALHRLTQFQARPELENAMLVTSVGRLTQQKVSLLKQILPSGKSALQELLTTLGENGLFIVLGSGDSDNQQFLTKTASRNSNFLYLQGFSEQIADALYESGDLFLMPSSFEPCGISQMVAMRAGQPCLVHSIGGLSDTVIDNKNGFSFNGNSMQEQAENMVQRFTEVLKIRKLKKWKTIGQQAAKERFLWSNAAKQYTSLLYKD
jgi:starch synthase